MTIASNEPHAAVLAFPFGSHAPPLLTIVRVLAKLSPETHFSFFSTAQSNSSLFSPAGGAPNVVPCNVSDGVPAGYVFTGRRDEPIELFLNAARQNFRDAIATAEKECGRKVSCLITDAFYWFGADMAEEIGASWVAFWTAGSCSLSAHLHTDLMRETIGIGDIKEKEEESLKFVPGMSKLLVGDLPEGVVSGDLDSIFSRMLHRMGQTLPRADVVFINTFEELELPITLDLKSKFKSFLNIGPLNLLSPPPPPPDSHGCLSWLDGLEASSVAYISFGTVTVLPPNELVAIAEALEASGMAYLWSMKDNVKAHLPYGFEERTRAKGKIVPWAPQLQVLAHDAIGVFVTHCGWNSLLESVGAGVPMICRPAFGDHYLNARTIENVLGVGEKIEGGVFSKDGLIKSLNKILKSSEGNMKREKIKHFKETVSLAIGSTGNSTKNLKTLLDVIITMGGGDGLH